MSKEKEKIEIEISSEFKVRRMSKKTKEKIDAAQAILSENWGFNVSLNATMNHLLIVGADYLITNNK